MAKRANPALIGAFVVGAVALAVAGLVLFGGGRFFQQTKTLVAYFEGSVKGVSIGAPVTFQGVKIGSVTDVRVVIEEGTLKIVTPVYFEIDAARLTLASGARFSFAGDSSKSKALIKAGLKAQLELQSFVTGQVGIGLSFLPDVPVKLTGLSKDHLEIPTAPSDIEKLTQTIEKLPVSEIVASLRQTLAGIQELVQSPETKETLRSLQGAVKQAGETLASVDKLARNVDGQVAPLSAEVTATARSARGALGEAQTTIARVGTTADATLAQARTTLVRLEPALEAALKDFQTLARNLDERVAKVSASLEQTLAGTDDVLGDSSPVRASLVNALDELAEAAHSIRTLANYLERNPSSLVFGKGRSAQ